MGVCNTPLRETENWKQETETTPEAGAEAKLILTMPCKKEFFYEVKKTETTHEAGAEAKLILTMPCKKEFFYEVKKTENWKLYLCTN